jgi:tetratricopeptide (TPR) repeat protein
MAKGEYQKAEQIFTNALQIDEHYSPVREALGKVKCVLGDYDAAKRLLANTRNQRDLAVFLNLLGVQYVDSQQFAKAIHHYKRAQFVLPGNEQSHLVFFNIALAYLKWGRLGEALSYARLAVTREPFYEKATKLLDLIEKRLSA